MKQLLAENDPSIEPDDGSQILTNPCIVKWFSTLFVNSFPLETTLQIWDAFLCDGIDVLHRIALVILLHSQSIPLAFTPLALSEGRVPNGSVLFFVVFVVFVLFFFGFRPPLHVRACV